jgi:hypothetical protein
MSHTPGPWFRNQIRTHGADPTKNGCDISAEDGSNIAIVLHILRERTAAQSVANADLVAAAPMLLEALQTIANVSDDDTYDMAMADLMRSWARDALSKVPA